MRTLKYTGTDSWGRPVYKDNTGKLWKDVNLGDGEPSLHSAVDEDFDGEPDMPIKGMFKIVSKPPVNDNEFQYLMLSRLRCDCEYFLGYGKRNPHRLWDNTITEHIAHMKQLWSDLPEDGKPERLTWEEILEYENEMLHGKRQRYRKDGQFVYFDLL